MTEDRAPFPFNRPTGRPPLDSQAVHLPPLTARSRNLVRFARHLPIETMDESFAGDFAFRDAGSRFSVLKSPKTTPGPDECYDSLTGFGNGHPEFMWSSAAVLLLAHGFYRQPPVYQSRRRYRQPPLLAGLPGKLRMKMGVG